MDISLAEVSSWQALAIFLLISALLGMLSGLLLIFRPHLLARINRVANRWISTQYINQWLDRSISIERWFYRHHRPMGLLIILGASYILVYFYWLFDKAYTLRHMPHYLPDLLMDGLLDALVIVLLPGAAVAFIAGFFIYLRPSLLRGMEKKANRWVSLPHVPPVLDRYYDQVDPFVARHAQSVGWLLLLGSLYLFFAMFRFLT